MYLNFHVEVVRKMCLFFFDEITHVFYYQSVQYKGFLGLQMILVEGPGSWYSGG